VKLSHIIESKNGNVLLIEYNYPPIRCTFFSRTYFLQNKPMVMLFNQCYRESNFDQASPKNKLYPGYVLTTFIFCGLPG
jgi:hypothetical protein